MVAKLTIERSDLISKEATQAQFEMPEFHLCFSNWMNHHLIVPSFFNPCSSSNHSSSPLRITPKLNLQRVRMDGRGIDTEGHEFNSAEEMWRDQIGNGDPLKKSQWYSQGVGYWQGVEATVDGVLGGYGHVNEPDIKGSEQFLDSVFAERFPDAASAGRRLVALDCGSGIGRVSKNLLIRYFNEVDLLEPVSHFLDAARTNLAPENVMVTEEHRAVNFFCVPLQEFTPESKRYDVIWVQWCIGHLSDDDFISFFNRAKDGLKPGGLFILKENIARSGFVLDKEDKSITRSDAYFRQLFSKCGLHIYSLKDQQGFPDELFAVKMYALTTELPKRASISKPKRRINRPGIIR